MPRSSMPSPSLLPFGVSTIASTRPRRASVAFQAAFGLLKRLGERCDLRAVDAGHLRVQDRRRFVRHLQLRLQFLPPAVEGLHLDLALVHRDLVVQHQVQRLLDARADPRDLALRGSHAGALLRSKPVHLARELVAEFLEQFLVQQFLLQGLENTGLNIVAADGETVVADALIARSETRQPVRAGHDETRAAHAALRQPGEQVLRAPRSSDVAAVRDRAPRCLLSLLRCVPQFVVDDAKRRHTLRDPLFCWIQS